MKVLIVAMYFPPAGGAGVPRTLKLAVHLPELGIDTHVLAPDDPKWLQRDETPEVPPRVVVHRARNLGPRSRRPTEELRALRGLDRLAAQAAITFRRLLVPDAAVLWNMTAIPEALRIVRREKIDVVLTTSPPGSVHLVGLAASRAGVSWVADLRDSIAAHPQRRRNIRGERELATLVARTADGVVTASQAIADEMSALGPPKRLRVITNGCDFEEFDGLEYHGGERFRITHTGSFFGLREARPFLDALARAPASVVARFVGDFRAADREYAERLGLGQRLDLRPYVPRREALALQRDSEALLLLIPSAGGRERGVLSAKVFEYLAAGRPILAAVPADGEAAGLLRGLGVAKIVPPDDPEAIAAGLTELEARWRAGELTPPSLDGEARRRLSRRTRSEEFAKLFVDIERVRALRSPRIRRPPGGRMES